MFIYDFSLKKELREKKLYKNRRNSYLYTKICAYSIDRFTYEVIYRIKFTGYRHSYYRSRRVELQRTFKD